MNLEKELPNTIANTPCCICGSCTSETYFDRRYDKFSYSGEFHMRRCTGCGLLFCSPRLSDEGIAQLYDANYYVFQKPDRDYFQRTAEIYQRTVAMLPAIQPKKVLEVGSGKGYLLAVMKKLGWSPLGVEISRDAVSYASNAFGLEGFAGTLDQYVAVKDKHVDFPVVLCIDIIEHVTDPDVFMSKLAQVTASGGYLIIDTPNANAARIEINGSNWRGFNPFHIFVFSETNLSKLLSIHGFTVEKSFTYNNENPQKQAPSFVSRLKGLIARFREPAIDEIVDLESCARVCGTMPSYFESKDAKGEWAAAQRGENLIVIARRN